MPPPSPSSFHQALTSFLFAVGSLLFMLLGGFISSKLAGALPDSANLWLLTLLVELPAIVVAGIALKGGYAAQSQTTRQRDSALSTAGLAVGYLALTCALATIIFLPSLERFHFHLI